MAKKWVLGSKKGSKIEFWAKKWVLGAPEPVWGPKIGSGGSKKGVRGVKNWQKIEKTQEIAHSAKKWGKNWRFGAKKHKKTLISRKWPKFGGIWKLGDPRQAGRNANWGEKLEILRNLGFIKPLPGAQFGKSGRKIGRCGEIWRG